MILQKAAAFSLALLFFSAAALPAQETLIDDVKRGHHNNEVVTIVGKVVSGPRVATQSVQGYYLEDRFTQVILVKTTKDLPPLETTCKVTGVAQLDADTREVFVHEEQRELLDQKPVHNNTASLPAPPADHTNAILMIGAAVLVLIAVAIFLTRRQQRSSGSPGGSEDTPPPLPSSADVDDFKTVKVYKTTKVLPGTLVVMDGGRETDVIYLSDQSGRGEVEIGRDSPDASGGIRIKDRTNTVSRRQARLVYAAATQEFRVVNLALELSNPTTLNGKSMRPDETALLTDGDLVGMGNLEVKFRKK